MQFTRNIVALQVEKRCWPYYHPPQTFSRNKIICCCKLKKFVEKSRRQLNLLQHASATCNNEILSRDSVWGQVVTRATTLFNLQRNNVACKLKKKMLPVLLGLKHRIVWQKIRKYGLIVTWLKIKLVYKSNCFVWICACGAPEECGDWDLVESAHKACRS